MANSFISKTERVYLLILGIMLSAVNAADVLIVRWDQARAAELGIYDITSGNFVPLGRFMSLFVVIFILFAKRYYFALAWTFLCFIPSFYAFISAYRIIHNDVDILYKTPAFALLALIANPLDYLSFFLTIILLIWLVSVVVRSLTVKDVSGLR